MTAGGPYPAPRPQAPYPQPQYPHPQGPRPLRPKRPAVRLVAGVLWLVAAGLGAAALFGNIYTRTFGDPPGEFVTGFWTQVIRSDGKETPSSPTIAYGIGVAVGAAIVLLAAIVVFASVRRWAGVVAGTFGTAVLATEALVWMQDTGANSPGMTTKIELGLWLLTGAAAVGLIALVVALTERTRPPAWPPLPPPPPPRPQPRWEPQTPRYGVPVQQPPPAQPPPAQPPTPAVEPADDRTTHLDTPERTTSIEPPKPAEPGQISRKLDGDEN